MLTLRPTLKSASHACSHYKKNIVKDSLSLRKLTSTRDKASKGQEEKEAQTGELTLKVTQQVSSKVS